MIHTTDAAKYEQASADYRIRLNGKQVNAFAARVSAMPFNHQWEGFQRPIEQTEMASFIHFSADEEVTIEVTDANGIREGVVRPFSAGVGCSIREGKAVFTLTKPGQYTFEPYGPHKALHIFFDSLGEWKYTGKEEGLIYFGPGVHYPGTIRVKSGETVYIDEDAVVYGSILGENVENVTVCGYGILDDSREERLQVFIEKNGFTNYDFARGNNGNMKFVDSRNIVVDGPVLRDSVMYSASFWRCENVRIHNVKTIGMWRYNSDGFDLCNTSDAVVSHCFLRNFDDCIVIKGVKFFDDRDVRNIRVEKCVIWCDWGRSLEIGAETCADEYDNIVFTDCDCIHNAWAVLDIQNGDRAVVHNVLYENIRVEYQRYTRRWMFDTPENPVYNPEDTPYLVPLMFAELYCNVFSNDGKLGENYDIRYRNIYVLAEEGLGMPPSVMRGADEAHTTHDVTIDGLFLNGRRITDMQEAQILCGPYAGKITLR